MQGFCVSVLGMILGHLDPQGEDLRNRTSNWTFERDREGTLLEAFHGDRACSVFQAGADPYS